MPARPARMHHGRMAILTAALMYMYMYMHISNKPQQQITYKYSKALTVCTSTFSLDRTTNEDVIAVISVVAGDHATHRMREVVLKDDLSRTVTACVDLTAEKT